MAQRNAAIPKFPEEPFFLGSSPNTGEYRRTRNRESEGLLRYRTDRSAIGQRPGGPPGPRSQAGLVRLLDGHYRFHEPLMVRGEHRRARRGEAIRRAHSNEGLGIQKTIRRPLVANAMLRQLLIPHPRQLDAAPSPTSTSPPMWPALTPTFINSLWQSAFDKLALGTVALLIGYLINRQMESIKSREGVRKTLLERRVTAILEQWDALRQLHWDITAAGDDMLLQQQGVAPRTVGPSYDVATLIQRSHAMTHAIRDRRTLLGKTIADAMYAAIAADLSTAKALANGELPDGFPQDSADYQWLEQILDAADLEDLPLVSRESSLSARRRSFLERSNERRAVAAATVSPAEAVGS